MRTCAVAAGLSVAAVLIGGCTAAAPTTTPPAKHAAAQGVRGQITAESGTTWTVTNARGRAFTVTLITQTGFGTAAAPAGEDRFPVGSQVRIVGAVTGTTVTATRIAAAGPAA